MEKTNNFLVSQMVESYAKDNDIEVENLFKKDLPNDEKITTKKVIWTPDKELINHIKDLDHNPVTYSREELIVDEDEGFINICDDKTMVNSKETMKIMDMKLFNINEAKKRFGIINLQITDNSMYEITLKTRIHTAASDPDPVSAKNGLDVIFREIVELHPQLILKSNDDVLKTNVVNAIEIPKTLDNNIIESEELKIIIDKSKISNVAWDDNDMEKIRKSRSIELNIVEDLDIKYSNFEDVSDSNEVDSILSKYKRTANDVIAALPASNYRATFSGLTYTEVLDLSHSQELNNMDNERKKWTIIFNHIHNPSIGPWEEYKYYIDPVTKKKCMLSMNDKNPKNIKVINVTKFEDFLMKTSFLDLEFMLWKILCATAMEKEIISIDCKKQIHDEVPCGCNYDWVYSPKELLVISDMNENVLDSMKQTIEANSIQEIKDHYKTSMLNYNNVIELPTSKFKVVFGHISAYEYLNDVYAKTRPMVENESIEITPAQIQSFIMLTIVKSFLIPNGIDENFIRITGIENSLKVINSLNEIDHQTMSEVVRLILEPYQLEFSLRDIKCPKCGNISNIDISSVSALLFIVARSLLSVQVILKRT